MAAAFGILSVRLINAAESDETFTALDIARLTAVTSAKISPDARWIAYSKRVQRNPVEDENGPAWVELHVVNRETGSSRPYVSGQVNVGSLAWSPDGRAISFLAKRGEEKLNSVYVIPIDGGEARRLIAHDTSISAYAWKPDGKHIAFLATEKEDDEKKKLEEKGFNARAYEENLKNVRIWIASADFESEVKPRILEVEGSVSDITWSPDGSRIAAAVAPTPLVDDYYMYRRIRVVNAESGLVVHKVDNPGKLAEIAWSPDGTQIAFLAGEDIHDPSEGRLMVADVASGKFNEIAKDYLPNVIDIDWHADESIMFLAHDGCESAIGTVKPDGSDRKLHLSKSDPIIESFSLAEERLALIGHTVSHPGEVFTTDLSSAPKRLTNGNPWLAKKKFGKQEVVEYPSRDGKTIQGILVRPVDPEPGKKYPLILMVHGGPEAHVSNGWVTRYSVPGQLAATEGYAAFYPNYRGSTGRGVAFAKDHQEDYGGKEFNDLLDGIDHLVKIGLVDRKKVGVTGGSYGGFASAWCATRLTDHFAAAVMFVGISNQISKSGTTDIPDEMFLVHARKRIWEDWEFFLKRSPIYYVEQARTPILILHGEEDTRVHPSQSMELYRNLKIIGKTPVRYVRYPGEGHGNRKAAARYDYTLRLMRWMNHFVKNDGSEVPPFEIDHGLSPDEEAKN